MRKYDLHRGRRRKSIRKRITEAESILCPGRFGNARGGDKRQIRMPSDLQHFHKYSWVYVDASFTLEANDKHTEFTQTIGKLIFNAKKVDENFVIN